MNDATAIDRQHDPSCPTWCDGLHDKLVTDFHHAHTLDMLEAPDLPSRDASRVEVRVSAYFSLSPVDDSSHEPLIEVHGLVNSGLTNLTLLAPAEAEWLAGQLLAAVRVLRQPSGSTGRLVGRG